MTPGFWTDASGPLAAICLALALLGSLYMILAAVLVNRFARRPRATAGADAPSVTILKPLHGDEPGLFENLASFCLQRYPGPVQVVFGIQNRADPAGAVVQRLQEVFPDKAIELVIDASLHGSNRKVSNLINMSAAIRHDVVLVADSDIRVERDFLSRVVAELQVPGTGGVTCLYHGEAAVEGVWSKLSALGINAHFLPNVVTGVALGLATPCFGSTIALRRSTLAEVGGFEAFADDLADDYAIGAALRRAGHRIAIPAISVGHASVEGSTPALWAHEMRWTRTIRVLDPLGFAGSGITYPLAWAVLGTVLAGFGAVSLSIAALALAARVLVAVQVERAFALPRQALWLIPARDCLSFAGFLWSFVGGAVRWKGYDFRVLRDGTLTRERRSPVP